EDIRFTTRAGNIYVICLDWPGEQLKVKALSSRTFLSSEGISDVKLLGSTEKLKWSQDGTGLTIQLPSERPCKYAFVFKVILNSQ
ncbi:MAG: alpha-L-fucosidase C-terminal domain-containing protein, partial [Planctomycetota bacterium]